MTKQEFLTSLRAKLQGLPKEDIDERVSFYEEMINDRIDEGEKEEDIIAELGSVDDVVRTIASDIPLAKLVKHKMTPKRPLPAWVIVIIVLGFPLWFPLVINALVLIFTGFVLIWTMVIAAYATEVAFSAAAVSGAVSFVAGLANGEMNLVALGSSILSLGAAIAGIVGCIYATIGTAKLTKRIVTGIKMIFIKKGER